MARNGAGTYVLPAGQPVVTGTTISSATHNTLANDLANALTTSIATDGQSVVTANIPFAGYKLTGIGIATVNGDAIRYEDKVALQATDAANLSAVQAGIQAQTYTAFTTAGTTTAYTLTPTPAIGSLVAGQRFRVKFNAANTSTTPTLAISGLAATAIKVYDPTGAKVNPAIGALALNMLTDVEYDGTDYVVFDKLTPRIILGTAVASTSGTSIDFTGIPSWAKKITVSCAELSTNGTDQVMVRLGTSGGVEATTYKSGFTIVSTSGVLTGNATTGLSVGNAGTANALYNGSMSLTLVDPATNTWAGLGIFYESQQTEGHMTAGSKALSGVLDRVRITTPGGANTFDSGTINILYEG
jgi:hypothetical protein